MAEFKPGDRVDVFDRGTDTFQPATIVALEIKPGTIGDPYDKPGFVVRYDNGCECWVRASNVYSPRANVAVDNEEGASPAAVDLMAALRASVERARAARGEEPAPAAE